ncbi:MAG: putative sulfatase, partial [Limisphaerales bacterium]
SYYGDKDLPDLAVRKGDWKFLCEYDGTDPQLYNLKTDRGETKNLASGHPKLVGKLTKPLIAWHKSLPPDNGPQLTGQFRRTPTKKPKGK